MIDFFHGQEVDRINLAGLEHVISCTVGSQADQDPASALSSGSALPTQQAVTDVTAEASTSSSRAATSASSSASNQLPLIHFRTFTTKLLNSGTRIPLLALEQAGPSFDFRLRRTQPADADVWKSAIKKQAKKALPAGQVAGKKRKDRNVDIDEMGDKVGRIHVGKQDLSKLQTRKMKGLKDKSRNEVVAEAEDDAPLDEAVAIPGSKRARV